MEGSVTRPAHVRPPAAGHRRLPDLFAVLCALLVLAHPSSGAAQDLPELTQPVNDFARVIDPARMESMDRAIRALQAATGDVVVVATVESFASYGSIEQYANKLFENHGRGIGEKGKDNGLLITVAVKEHRVWIEVGYGLEPYITDGFSGETSRLYMIPEFRRNDYGAGLEAGVQRIVGRLAAARGVALDGVPNVAERPRSHRSSGGASALGIILIVAFFVVVSILSTIARAAGGPRRWGRGPWSGWNSGVGPFGGGGFGGGFGGGGGGFGGFGGGASGGGGGGGSW
jgi:uncharacterized protein